MQAQLLNCTAAILSVCEEDCVVISQQLFNLLITVLSQNQEARGQVCICVTNMNVLICQTCLYLCEAQVQFTYFWYI